jgi:hypothetical protein
MGILICSHQHKPVILYYLAEQFLFLAYLLGLCWVVQIGLLGSGGPYFWDAFADGM